MFATNHQARDKETGGNMAYHKCYILNYICIYIGKFDRFSSHRFSNLLLTDLLLLLLGFADVSLLHEICGCSPYSLILQTYCESEVDSDLWLFLMRCSPTPLWTPWWRRRFPYYHTAAAHHIRSGSSNRPDPQKPASVQALLADIYG